MPVITGLHAVGIPVTDQGRAEEFYRSLGFETRLDVPMGEDAQWIEVAPPGTAVTLALESAHAERPAGVETGIRLTTGDVDAAHAAMAAQGVDVDDVLRWPGVPPMFAFRDQDGNGLEIVEA
jgi:catechol 2,3-dioxygenase-like lactoylglutathione lyase family enzyme